MRSRSHAIGVSMVAAVLPLLGWLATVIVALVVLRLGVVAGFLVLLWTMLPVGVAFYLVGDPSPALALCSTFTLAALLRRTLSWELVLVAAVILSVISTVIFELTAADILARFVEFYLAYVRQIDESAVPGMAEAQNVLISFFALGQAYAMLGMLIIARWCQSALYNPNGLRNEFHALRLSPIVSVSLIIAMLLCFVFSEQLGRWLPLLTVPLIFASFGLIHWGVAYKKLSKNWIGGFYAGLVLLFQLVYPFLASLALMDSWFDIRKRISTTRED